MKCAMCKHGKTAPGQVTVTLQRGDCVVITKGVPAEVCENCGEHYLDENVSEQLLQRAEVAAKKGTEVEIIKFAA